MNTELNSLVTQAQAGDRAAFGQLLFHVQDLAVAFCYGTLGDRELARDAAQDAFVDAYLHFSQLSEPLAFPAWFRRVLHKHCDRHWRRKRHTPDELAQHASLCADHHCDAEAQLIAGERAHQLASAIEALPEHERLVVALYYIAGQSLAQIAALLELEVTTIKQRLFSARNHLRDSTEQGLSGLMQSLRPSHNTGFSNEVSLFLAVRMGEAARVRTLLADHPELRNAPETWDRSAWPERDLPLPTRATPLVVASERGRLEVVRALLDAGAAVDGSCGCSTHETPLWAATVATQREVASELLRRGADANAGASNQITCLHAAAIRGAQDLVQLLLAHGADRERRDGAGRSAADWARIKGHLAIAALLDDKASPATSLSGREPSGREAFYATGIKALDLFAPLIEGSLTLVQGRLGVGRNILLAELIEVARRRADTACIWVVWEREPWSDAELAQLLAETGTSSHVRVLREAHDQKLAKANTLPARAVALAEQLIHDGARHVQLCFLERPQMCASIEAIYPEIAVRADGSAISALLVPPGQDDAGPVVEPRAPIATWLAFDESLARARRFPALDTQRSRSRWLDSHLVGQRHSQCARTARELLATLTLGEHRDDVAWQRALRLRAYLTQPFHVAEPFSGRPGTSVPIDTLLDDVSAILAGDSDHLTPLELSYRGALQLSQTSRVNAQ